MENQRRPSSTVLPFQVLLEHNDLGFIENPLRRIHEDHLSAYVESFYEASDLADVVDLTILTRGARLARDEDAFISEEKAEGNFTAVEMAALGREKTTSIWSEGREVKIILLTCCVGSVVQGWVSGSSSSSPTPDCTTPSLASRGVKNKAESTDSRYLQVQGAIVGANRDWPTEFHLDVVNRNSHLWIFSATNAIVYFAASSVGALLCDPFTEIFVGRRGAIFAAALFTTAASIGEYFTHSWQALFACRL